VVTNNLSITRPVLHQKFAARSQAGSCKMAESGNDTTGNSSSSITTKYYCYQCKGEVQLSSDNSVSSWLFCSHIRFNTAYN